VEIPPLIGIACLALLDRVIGIVMQDPGEHFDFLFRNLFVHLGGIAVVRHGDSARPAFQDPGLLDRPAERVVTLVRATGRTAAEPETCLSWHEVGHFPGAKLQKGLGA
jgi:hypothetical protein